MIFVVQVWVNAVFATSWINEEASESFSLPHLKYAQGILSNVTISKIATTTYCHDNIVERQEFRFNCYGFVSYLINVTHSEAFEELISHMEQLTLRGIPTSLDPDKPSPYNFFHIFRNLYLGELKSQYWEGIEDIYNLEVGDILVYLKPDYISPLQWDKSDLSNSTGTHIMLVSAIIDKSFDMVEIKIIDSTNQPHNQTDDTRFIHSINNGIGESSVRLIRKESRNTYGVLWNKYMKNGWVKELFAGRIRNPGHPLRLRDCHVFWAPFCSFLLLL